ncbi:MAG: CHAT domain-containing protein [Myxococcota bacterium]
MRRRSFLTLLAFTPFALAAGVDEGELAWDAGDLDRALLIWEKALAGAEGEARVDLLLRVASVHRAAGRLAKADASLVAAEKLGLLAARVANDRGLWHLAAGDPKRAVDSVAAAFKQARDAGDPALAANAATNLGLARMALGRPEEAAKAFTGAAELFVTLGDDVGRADALTNLGLAHRRAGRLREARASLEEAIALFRGKGAVAGEIDATNDLAIVLQELGMDEAAAPLYEAALKKAKDPRRQAALYANYATVFHRRGDARKAEELYRKAESLVTGDERAAITLQRALLGEPDVATYRALYEAAKDPRTRAIAALNLGGMVWKSDPALAAKLAAEARASGDASAAWRADYLDGKVLLAAGKRDDAIAALRRAVDALERTRRGLGEDEAKGFRTSHDAVYETLMDAMLATGDTRGAAAAAERMVLADLGAPPIPDDPAAAELRALSEREAWLQRSLAGAPEERAAALRAQLGQLQAEFAMKVDQLRATYPHFAELVRTDPEDLEAVRRELPAGVVVVQPVLLPDRLLLLVYRRERLLARDVKAEGNRIAQQVALVARSLRAADTWDPAWTRQQCDVLGEWLLKPIEEELKDASVVVWSATGVFRQLPFALVRLDGKWLAERAAVVNVTHVGSLRAPAAAFATTGSQMLLVGNPDGTLPGAEAEVRDIAKAFDGARVLVRTEGTRDAVLENARERRVVHLATHGMLDPEAPDRSHLVLTGYPDLTGRLTYREIPGLGPWLDTARLVVLSACESGLPVDPVPRDGAPAPLAINGLAAQFRRAGVETLVASLWKVDDAGTMTLMEAFYAELAKGVDIARAMQAAQKKLIGGELAHPYYWAPFVVMGDWR